MTHGFIESNLDAKFLTFIKHLHTEQATIVLKEVGDSYYIKQDPKGFDYDNNHTVAHINRQVQSRVNLIKIILNCQNSHRN